MIVAAASLLARNPRPTRAEIRAALDGNLCRCGGYLRILEAVEKAARGSVDGARGPA
jgi:aerobic-type carbon monoxide dehydrogenase small subunit (CoxS/CutS family)